MTPSIPEDQQVEVLAKRMCADFSRVGRWDELPESSKVAWREKARAYLADAMCADGARRPPITSDDLTAALELGLDAQRNLADPEAAGFEPDAIRDFLEFIRAHGGIEVPDGHSPGQNAPVHYGSLMAGLVMGAVAARTAASSRSTQQKETPS